MLFAPCTNFLQSESTHVSSSLCSRSLTTSAREGHADESAEQNEQEEEGAERSFSLAEVQRAFFRAFPARFLLAICVGLLLFRCALPTHTRLVSSATYSSFSPLASSRLYVLYITRIVNFYVLFTIH